MTAPAEPDLDLSHLLTEVPAPPDGAARVRRTAGRRHVVRRAAAAGAVLVAVAAAVAAVTIIRSDSGDRTVRTAGEPMNSAALLSTADVATVVSQMSPVVFGNHSHTGTLRHIVLWTTPFVPESGATHQWSWHGVPDASGRAGDRVTSVEASVLRFRDSVEATTYLTNVTEAARGNTSAPFTGIPGAVEVDAHLSPNGVTSDAVLFPRDSFVYVVRIGANGVHADELHRLAIRQAQLVGAGTTSCPVSSPLTGSGDGLPQEGLTTLEHVQQTLTRNEARIRNDFAGVRSLSVEPRNGEVWTGVNGGAYSVHRAADYWIVVHVESPALCPVAPAAFHAYDGVPLHFVVG